MVQRFYLITSCQAETAFVLQKLITMKWWPRLKLTLHSFKVIYTVLLGHHIYVDGKVCTYNKVNLHSSRKLGELVLFLCTQVAMEDEFWKILVIGD